MFQSATPQHQRVPLINHGAQGRLSITDGHWKLIMPFKKLPLELYNLKEDPSETQNVVETETQRAEQLTQSITRIVCRGRSTSGPRQANDTGYWPHLTWMTNEDYLRESAAE